MLTLGVLVTFTTQLITVLLLPLWATYTGDSNLYSADLMEIVILGLKQQKISVLECTLEVPCRCLFRLQEQTMYPYPDINVTAWGFTKPLEDRPACIIRTWRICSTLDSQKWSLSMLAKVVPNLEWSGVKPRSKRLFLWLQASLTSHRNLSKEGDGLQCCKETLESVQSSSTVTSVLRSLSCCGGVRCHAEVVKNSLA